MKPNLQHLDRLVRVLIGAPLALSYIYVRHVSGRWGLLLLVTGLCLLVSAFIGWSPVYGVLDRSSKSRRSRII